MTGAAADLSPARFDAGVVADANSLHAPAWIELKDIAPIRFRKKARD